MVPSDSIRYYFPASALRPVVHHYEYIQIDNDHPIGEMRLVPSFGQGLVFCFPARRLLFIKEQGGGSLRIPDCVVLGPVSQPVCIAYGGCFSALRTVFQPGMISCLFAGHSVTEYRDRLVDARRHLDRGLGELHRRLIEAKPGAPQISVIESYLLTLWWGQRTFRCVFPLLRDAVDQAQGIPVQVSHLAGQAGLSRQHLNRLCVQQLGYTVKQALGVLRFTAAVVRLHTAPIASLSQAAVEFGYYDQAHFTREFRRYSSLTPARYLRQVAGKKGWGGAGEFQHSGIICL